MVLKKDYKYNEDKCNNKDNEDDDSDNDDDWKIECIDVIVRLVSITPGHVKLDWLPPSKIDRSNENDRDDDNESNSDSNDKDNDEDNKDKDKKM